MATEPRKVFCSKTVASITPCLVASSVNMTKSGLSEFGLTFRCPMSRKISFRYRMGISARPDSMCLNYGSLFLARKGARNGPLKRPKMEVCGNERLPMRPPNLSSVITPKPGSWPIRAAQILYLARWGRYFERHTGFGVSKFPQIPRKATTIPMSVLMFLRKYPTRSLNFRKVARAPSDRRSGAISAMSSQ